ncbi:hypothetical protein [Gordonia polyisoprenivorans]|uniref:hypothetical protein n=1 Tax=Gordonia polyisoprenivorans TaxID=84595 RepID=UPI0018CAE0AB
MATATATPPVRFGHLNRWFYAARGFLTPFFGTGTVNVLFGIVGKPMADEFGWSRSVITIGSRSSLDVSRGDSRRVSWSVGVV